MKRIVPILGGIVLLAMTAAPAAFAESAAPPNLPVEEQPAAAAPASDQVPVPATANDQAGAAANEEGTCGCGTAEEPAAAGETPAQKAQDQEVGGAVLRYRLPGTARSYYMNAPMRGFF